MRKSLEKISLIVVIKAEGKQTTNL